MVFHSNPHRRVAVTAALLVAGSCGDVPSTAPPTAELERAESVASHRARHGARGHLLRRSVALQNEMTTSATISPEGGFLWFAETGLLLHFPQGAVSEPTVVTATALKGDRVAYDFQPHGLTFNTPIYVAQQLWQTELDAPRAQRKHTNVWGAYLSNGAGDILSNGSAHLTQIFDAFYVGTGTETLAVFTTTHFSGYAFGSGRHDSKSE